MSLSESLWTSYKISTETHTADGLAMGLCSLDAAAT